MCIQIKYKKVLGKYNEQKIRILKLQALTSQQLPAEYLDANQSLRFESRRLYDTNRKTIRRLAIYSKYKHHNRPPVVTHTLVERLLYDKESFSQFISIAKRCGDTLQEINRKRRTAAQKAWHGTETINI